MTCHAKGCRNLKTVCEDCGRVVSTMGMDEGWISVKDRLPEEGVRVLTFMNGYEIKVDYIVECDEPIWACILDHEQNKVTHWMSLPDNPKDE